LPILVSAAASYSLFKCVDFFGRERADGAGWHVAEAHRADGDAAEFLHFVTNPRQEPADFAITAFVEDHFKQRRSFAPALDPHVLGVRKALGQVHAAMELADGFAFHLAGDLYLIDFLNAVSWMGEPVGKLAVVGDEDKSFAGDVEPADRKHARRVRWQKVDDARAAGRIASRRDDTFRLVHGEVDKPRPAQRFAVDADFLSLRIDASAELRHDLMIDFHAAFENQLFALAPTGHAGGSEKFL
jgi:hypothetical protein